VRESYRCDFGEPAPACGWLCTDRHCSPVQCALLVRVPSRSTVRQAKWTCLLPLRTVQMKQVQGQTHQGCALSGAPPACYLRTRMRANRPQKLVNCGVNSRHVQKCGVPGRDHLEMSMQATSTSRSTCPTHSRPEGEFSSRNSCPLPLHTRVWLAPVDTALARATCDCQLLTGPPVNESRRRASDCVTWRPPAALQRLWGRLLARFRAAGSALT
jgi:hypothetical protein